MAANFLFMATIEPEIELTPKQIRFCEEYVIDWNGARAAIAAGYSENSAKEIACQNLTKVNIQEYIEKIKNDLSRLSGVTALRNINELAKMAYSNLADMVDESGTLKPFDKLTDAEKAAISELYTESITIMEGDATVTKRKLKLHSKVQAIDLLNKMLGFNAAEKKEITAEIKSRVDDLFPPENEILEGYENPRK